MILHLCIDEIGLQGIYLSYSREKKGFPPPFLKSGFPHIHEEKKKKKFEFR